MTEPTYAADRTGILLVDPYNDAMSEGGKLFPRVKDVATSLKTVENMKRVVSTAKASGMPIFYVAHHRHRDDDFAHWRNLTPLQKEAQQLKLFAVDTWGGDWHPDFRPGKGDVMVKEHLSQSGFASTDLDEQLKQHGVGNVVVIGMFANTCVEATARYGMELGYHVTLVRDATAAPTMEGITAAHEVNAPLYAHAVLTTDELLNQFPSKAPA